MVCTACSLVQLAHRVLWAFCLVMWLNASTALAVAELTQGPRFEDIFNDFNIPMLLIEPDSGAIVEANVAAAGFYGYTRQQLAEMRIQQINTFTAEQVASERALAESEGRNYFIFRHQLANGEMRRVEVYSRPYEFEGKTLLYSIINDITPGRHQNSDLWYYQQQLEQMVDEQVGEIETGRRWQLWTLAGALFAQALVITLLVGNMNRRRQLERQGKAANQALEASRYQLEEAQRIARVGSWQMDHSTGLISCSTEMCQMLELESDDEEQPIQRARERIHPDDWAAVDRAQRLSMEKHLPFELDHRLLMPDGRIKHVHVKGESRCSGDNTELVTVGTVQDVTRQYVVQSALAALATEYALLSGQDFYRAVCRHLVDVLGLDYVFVGQLSADRQEVEAIVGCTPEGDMQPFVYALEGTPCADVMTSIHSVYPANIARAYPNDAILVEKGIESYIASSLLDKQQEPMGILVGLGCKPLLQQELAWELLNVFVDRVSAEMQRTAAERRIKAIDTYRQIVLGFANRFMHLSLPEVDRAIQAALHEIGHFIKADSCYLFTYDLEAGTASMTHEWCIEGMLREKEQLQQLPLSRFPGWIEHHEKGLPVIVENTDELGEEYVAEILKRKGIRCLVDLPLMSNGECLGFVGVASRRQTNLFGSETVELLELFASLLVNIRRRQQVEGQLRLSASVFDNADESIMITDAAGQIITVNDAFSRTTGYTADQARGQALTFMNVHDREPGFRDQVQQQLDRFGYWKGEAWNRHAEGERYAVLQKINAFHDEAGGLQGYVSLMSDITALKQHQRQLERIAHFDALTGLPNRNLLADRLQQAMATARRQQSSIAILFIDLDGFKAVNDTHSHAVGDQLLVRLAQRMQHAIRQEDSMARIGGDEFVAVLVGLDHTDASIPVIRRLLDAIAEPVNIDGAVLEVSASIGVAFYPQQENLDADQLLRQADQAMYHAKQAGKNRYQLFDVERDREVRSQHDSLERVRLALYRSELELHYQPKVNMRTGELVGCEALIRWRHPRRGLLMPAAFLPVIENQLLAVDVGNWVLAEAMDQILAWRKLGLVVPVSVNIDAIHLQQPDFVQHLSELLQQRPGIQPGDLELEILETTALGDVEQVSGIIRDCDAQGVGFALDDFGTGYSSLTYLKRLPAQLLKIDRSFVRDMLVDPDDLAILNGVIQLAAAFKREVIAEGVETEQHCRELLRLGCELGQGYAIARPMPAAELPQWLSEWHRKHPAVQAI